jgi:DNA polymerase-4
VRLIGVGVSNFGRLERQLGLFESATQTQNIRDGKINAALDAIRDKFGREAIVRGRLFDFRRKKDEG